MDFLPSLSAHFPELCMLFASGLLFAWNRLFPNAKPWEGFGSAFGCLAVIAILLLVRLNGFADLELAALKSTSTFHGWMKADQFANLFQLLLTMTFVVVLLLAPRRSHEANSPGFGGFHATLLFGLAVASLALSSFHLLLTAVLLEVMERSFRSLECNPSVQRTPSNESDKRSPSKSLLPSRAFFWVGTLLLAAQAGGFTYKAVSVSLSQAWGDGVPWGMLLSWMLLSIGILLKVGSALKCLVGLGSFSSNLPINSTSAATASDPSTTHNFGATAALFAVATPIVFLGVWLRLSTAIFAGLVESASLAGGADGTLAIIRNVIILAAVGCMIFGLMATRKAKGPIAILLAATPIHLGFWLACTSGLSPQATIVCVTLITSFAISMLGAIAGLQAIQTHASQSSIHSVIGVGLKRPWLSLGLVALVFSLVGLPPTVGFLAKWGMFTELLGEQHFSLQVFVAAVSIGLIAAYFPILRQLFLPAPAAEGVTFSPSADQQGFSADPPQGFPAHAQDLSAETQDFGRQSAKSAYLVVWICVGLALWLFEPSGLLQILQKAGNDVAFW